MRTIYIGLFTFFITLSVYSQEVFIYNESGGKVYFQKIDSVIQVKFNDNVNFDAKLEIAKMINPDKAYSHISERNRLLIPIDKNKKPNYDELRKNPSIVYANPSLISNDGTIQIPTDKVLVRIKNSFNLEDILFKLNVEYKSYKRLGHNKDSYLIVLKNGESINTANYLYKSGYFIYAQPSFTRLINVMNEFYSDQWGLNNTGQNNGTVGIDIDAPQAWNITTGCDDIVVAVIDQGVDLDHPDLDNNLLGGYDATDGGSGGVNGDCWGNDAHGTACAGIIAAEDNTIGIIGVAPNCNIVPIRIFYTINNYNISDDDWIVDAINHAWEIDGVDIMSCSWGGGSPTSAINNEIDDALTQGRNNLGCIIVFAAGNYNSEIIYPANSNPDIIAVGAMSPCGERKRSSSNSSEVNPGVTPDPEGVSCDGEKWWGSNYGSQLDLVAPGVLIPTTDIQGSAGYNTSSGTGGNYYAIFNGTSSATPHVAGIAALILSINSSLTQDQVRDEIESSCDKVGGYSYSTTSGRSNGKWDHEMGYGKANAHKALLSVLPTISGPTIVCTSGATFTINNRAPGTTINWTPSNNLSELSPNNETNYIVKAKYSYTSGPGWVEATISGDCGDVTIRENIDWVGKPNPWILGPTTLECNFPEWYFINSESYQWGDFYWSTDYMLRIIGTTTGHKAQIEGLEEGYGQIFCEVTNTCGSTETRLVVWIECWGFKMAPNPADDYVEISIDESKLVENKIDEYEVRIYNSMNIMVSQIKTSKPILRINTRQFINGVYYVNFIFNDKLQVEQLVISH